MQWPPQAGSAEKLRRIAGKEHSVRPTSVLRQLSGLTTSHYGAQISNNRVRAQLSCRKAHIPVRRSIHTQYPVLLFFNHSLEREEPVTGRAIQTCLTFLPTDREPEARSFSSRWGVRAARSGPVPCWFCGVWEQRSGSAVLLLSSASAAPRTTATSELREGGVSKLFLSPQEKSQMIQARVKAHHVWGAGIRR